MDAVSFWRFPPAGFRGLLKAIKGAPKALVSVAYLLESLSPFNFLTKRGDYLTV